MAQEFDWERFSGETLKVLLLEHPYQQALLAELSGFTKLTGIQVDYEVVSDDYFDVVTLDLASGKRSRFDLFMTDVYHLWQYAPAGWIEPLELYLGDPSKTHPDYDVEDMFLGLRESLTWNLKPGRGHLGQGSLYALPWGFQAPTLVYRKDVFEASELSVPTSLEELLLTAKTLKESVPEAYGIAVAGSLDWRTLTTSFMTVYSSYGCIDFDQAMQPQMNSPCALELTRTWLDLIKYAGPKDWLTYTDEQAVDDFMQGKVAMLFDGDFIQNYPDDVAWARGPSDPDQEPRTNLWMYALAMNASSKHKDAAWLFLQWATGKEFLTKGAVDYHLLNPVRRSIWENPAFKEKMSRYSNYIDTIATIMSKDAKVQFAPQPLFFETTAEWMQALHDIYLGADAQERLDALVQSLTKQLKDAGIIED